MPSMLKKPRKMSPTSSPEVSTPEATPEPKVYQPPEPEQVEAETETAESTTSDTDSSPETPASEVEQPSSPEAAVEAQSPLPSDERNSLFDHPFENDIQAIQNLEKFQIEYKGGTIKLVTGTDYPPQVLNAADYLCDEWDYAAAWIPSQAEAVASLPVSDEQSPEEKAAAAFEARHEALTENYVACSINRAKLDAALKMAKKREKDALEDLSDHIDKGPQVMPLFDRPVNPQAVLPTTESDSLPIVGEEYEYLGKIVNVTEIILCDGGPAGSATVNFSTRLGEHGTCQADELKKRTPPAPVDPDAWKAASIDELQLKPALTERLKEAGIDTVGKLEAFRADAADHREKWPKGVGTAKITEIENAVIDWLTKHRDAHLFPSSEVASSETAEATESEAIPPTYPTEAEWDAMTEEAQTSWLNERSVHLDSDDLDALANRVAEGCDDFFTDGCEAFGQGDEILHCPHAPGIECDAWIMGWLWQGKQDEEGGENE